MALLCGALLSQSGAVVQTALGNAFASPSTVGISAGALLGAMVINLFIDNPSIWEVWVSAFVFSLVISMLILLLSQVIGGGKLQLILIGMAMSLAVGALSSAIMIYAEQRMDGLFLWGSGNIGQTDSHLLSIILLPSLLLLVLPMMCHRQLDMLSLGDDTANVVGLSVRRWRAILLLIAVLQASLVTAMVGVLGFVGLMAPHIARMLGFNKARQQNNYATQPTLKQPYDMPLEFVDVDGVRIRMARSLIDNSKETIVFLSAFPHTIVAYSPIWEELKKEYNLYAYDLP